jgi:hypothetical protein
MLKSAPLMQRIKFCTREGFFDALYAPRKIPTTVFEGHMRAGSTIHIGTCGSTLRGFGHVRNRNVETLIA